MIWNWSGASSNEFRTLGSMRVCSPFQKGAGWQALMICLALAILSGQTMGQTPGISRSGKTFGRGPPMLNETSRWAAASPVTKRLTRVWSSMAITE